MTPPVRCPRGHASETDDFCDECGAPIVAPGGLPSVPTSLPQPGTGGAALPPPLDEVCPWCGTPRTGRFCEEDGYDFVAAGSVPPPEASSPAPTARWVVTVEADRKYYESVRSREGPDIEAVTFPHYYPREEIALDGEEVRVGRRRAGGAATGPQVDLAGPPLDPGVSHRHAVLLPEAAGGWSVLDPGSTNGTTINYGDEAIPVDTRVPLADGDRIHVGAFTTLTVERRA